MKTFSERFLYIINYSDFSGFVEKCNIGFGHQWMNGMTRRQLVFEQEWRNLGQNGLAPTASSGKVDWAFLRYIILCKYYRHSGQYLV